MFNRKLRRRINYLEIELRTEKRAREEMFKALENSQLIKLRPDYFGRASFTRRDGKVLKGFKVQLLKQRFEALVEHLELELVRPQRVVPTEPKFTYKKIKKGVKKK